MSLSRIPLGFLVVFYLWRDDSTATLIAALLLILAGITDALDGYLARRAGNVTKLGIALDPIADKLFAGIVTIGLILFRGFPLWLAAMVIGRDLLIVGFSRFLARGRDVSLPSNLIGKWAFAWLATLLGAYVIRFEFSISILTPLVAVLLIASAISYGRVFLIVRSGGIPKPFADRTLYRSIRYSFLAAMTIVHAIMFYREFLS
jgi:CDP-diacylglycerol--glycerol-3-phosphate 3-phosphatidyltransferase